MSQLCARKSLAVVFSILAVAVTLKAQVTTAEIVGTVFDNSGAVMSNATVTIKHLGTGEVRTMLTNATGEYVFTLLAIGTYTVTVESGGFRKFVGSNVTLTAGDRIRVDAKMEVGEVSQQVQVAEQIVGLQTDSSTLGASVSSTSVEDLPTNGRNFLTLVQIGAA